MAEGTNPAKTDSIISLVEAAAWRVNDDFTSGKPEISRWWRILLRG
jgi:hypothetical protein